MYTHEVIGGPKQAFYARLTDLLDHLLASESDPLANLCSAAGLLGCQLKDINWVGFYLWRDGQLILGPFQGKPACTRIQAGRGVCGVAAAERKTQIVSDVQAFPGHIACDPASRSEIVVPVLDQADQLYGVLDVDSPLAGRFDDDDARGLEACAAIVGRWVAGMGAGR